MVKIMYKVMLVDDDYPAIEFLTEAIDWNASGFELVSTHENGMLAFEYAKENPPDLLITDIGMPKMDGIELTKQMKKLKENIQVAIISCHNEFAYAQQALKLNVQDYILKESLDPDDLKRILLDCKKRLDNNATNMVKVKKLEHKVKLNHDYDNQKLLRQYMQGTSNKFLTLLDKDSKYIPVYFYINNYYKVKKNFMSIDTMQFAVLNIIKEIIDQQELSKVYSIHYEGNKGFLFYHHSLSIKNDVYKELNHLLVLLQTAINKYLDIQISFMIGKKADANSLKKEIRSLIESEKQIFYSVTNSCMKRQDRIADYNGEEIFEFYQEVSNELKQAIFQRDMKNFEKHLNNWIEFCTSNNYNPKVVKEWFLRMILDLKMRLRTIPYLQSNYSVESLQEEVFLLDNIYELRGWLTEYAQNCLDETKEQLKNNYHKDVLSACYYVSNNIEKKLSLDEIAEHLFLNASYFSRLFKKEMQINFVEYVKQRKV